MCKCEIFPKGGQVVAKYSVILFEYSRDISYKAKYSEVFANSEGILVNRTLFHDLFLALPKSLQRKTTKSLKTRKISYY